MAKHARESRSVDDKRSALAGAQRNAYVHRDQVGGTRRREADGRWVDRPQEPIRQRERARQQANQPLTIGEFIKRNIVYILSVVAVAIIIVLLVFGVRMFADLSRPLESGEYVSPYDWSNLDRTGGHYAYIVNGQVKSRLGVDVAEHDYDIDWDAVAADGVEFAMIRLGYRGATEGELYLDGYYEANMEGAKAAGIDRGVYFFSQAATVDEAIEEADFVLSTLGGMNLEYPVAYDFEYVTGVGETRVEDLTDEELSDIANAFCNRIEQAGYPVLVYGNARDLRSYDVDVMTGRDIWWAEYGVEEPSHYLDIKLWQYTSEGHVDGIEGQADLNIDLTNVLS